VTIEERVLGSKDPAASPGERGAEALVHDKLIERWRQRQAPRRQERPLEQPQPSRRGQAAGGCDEMANLVSEQRLDITREPLLRKNAPAERDRPRPKIDPRGGLCVRVDHGPAEQKERGPARAGERKSLLHERLDLANGLSTTQSLCESSALTTI